MADDDDAFCKRPSVLAMSGHAVIDVQREQEVAEHLNHGGSGVEWGRCDCQPKVSAVCL